MPNAHKVKTTFTVRPDDDDLAERVKTGIEVTGMTMNAWMKAVLRWAVGDTDELPPRMFTAADQPTSQSRSKPASR